MTDSRRTTLLATAALLAMTACWGSTFFLIKDLLDRVPTLDFLAVRFAIASIVLLLAAPRAVARLSPETRKRAAVLGLLYGVAQILQTAGLAHTAASVSGFITGMYVVATPLFAALLLRTRITPLTWAAVALAAVGLGILTLDGFAVGYGEAITLVAALLYALHIVGLGAWSNLTILLLVLGGAITAIPLLLFTAAARRLPYSTMGFLQYIAPSLQFMFAVVLFGEALTTAHLICFGAIWTALAIVSVDGWRRAMRSRRAQALPAESLV